MHPTRGRQNLVAQDRVRRRQPAGYIECQALLWQQGSVANEITVGGWIVLHCPISVVPSLYFFVHRLLPPIHTGEQNEDRENFEPS